ncbi:MULTISPECIES: peptidoglycan DD-metalloendopeptidase family protein [unclassified Legionella]|uniref:peptidoglycan DD-metalloendopeptidase family protein n=1 Tax=unclassified Legionella TaxID=2622702 RepID=UPI00105474B7|nr:MULTISPECIES: peptidoglycan DD-metalloendopeptidase family protein [unclassified Legionella]MDI9818362.1 peptidoglycan DD-metalloendopeptidase family protein [Legionella sp. PL877]
MKNFLKLAGFATLFFIIVPTWSITLPENHSVNGGLTIIPIDIKGKPEVYYEGKKIAVVPSFQPNQWLLIVGIPLDKQEAIQNLLMTKPYKMSIPFHVTDKFYTAQYLTISNNRLVDPYENDKLRIDKENKEMAELYAQFSPMDPFAEGFKAPAHGPITSLFGLRRFYNNQSRPPHSGLDIGAPESSPVHTIAKGNVVSTKDYFFTGNTVIVDHGMGVFSLYAHLKRMDVKVGDHLKQGEQVGIVGQTGRATGPHLHWSMIMNQTLVDPLLFVPVRIITAVPKKAQPQQKEAEPKTGGRL